MLRVSFNNDWTVGDNVQWPRVAAEPVPVTLPHDAMIGTKRDENSVYWFQYGGFKGEDKLYKKIFDVPSEMIGQKMIVEFEGVYYNSHVLVNGHIVAARPYGYSRFTADISGFVVAGKNEMQVIVSAGTAPNSRWYPGTGIYRDVWMMTGGRLYVDPWGIKVTTNGLYDGAADLTTDIKIINDDAVPRTAVLKQKLIAPDGTTAAEYAFAFTARPGEDCALHHNFAIENAALWSPETPRLYNIEVSIEAEGNVIDSAKDRFGIRMVSVDAVRGFRVNGKEYKLRGGCIHHDNGPIGTAEFKTAAYRRVRLMKEAGYNAIRSSHNPMSPALLEACDELGVLVMDESFDTWRIAKTAYDYNMSFTHWWDEDIRSMVAKDYNHPCVVMYSIGNEISERDGSNDGGAWARRQAELIRSLDHTRPVTSAICGVHDPNEKSEPRSQFTGKKGFEGVPVSKFTPKGNKYFIERTDDYAEALDVMSLNYQQGAFEDIEAARPGRVLCGTESMVAQYAGLWELVEKHSYVLGDFCWTAWEYLGEAGCGKIDYIEDGHKRALESFMGDYPWVMAYCGDFDLTGMRRTQSYYREIVWHLRKEPYIAVQRPEKHGMTPQYTPWSWSDTAGCWYWPGFEGKETDIEVYADADEVELFLNGASLGRKQTEKFCAMYTAEYTPGVLKAVAYKDGKVSSEYELATTGNAAGLRLTAETGNMASGRRDVAYIRIEAVDANGNKVYCRPAIKVAVEGTGVLAGLGSGDPMTDGDYTDDVCELFDGTAIAIVRSTDEKGACRVKVSAEGIGEAEIEIQAE